MLTANQTPTLCSILVLCVQYAILVPCDPLNHEPWNDWCWLSSKKASQSFQPDKVRIWVFCSTCSEVGCREELNAEDLCFTIHIKSFWYGWCFQNVCINACTVSVSFCHNHCILWCKCYAWCNMVSDVWQVILATKKNTSTYCTPFLMPNTDCCCV